MALVKFHHPVSPVFSNVWNDFFNQDIGKFIGSEQPASLAKVNVIENEKDFQLEVAAPGLKKEDFQLNLDKNILSIEVAFEKNSEETEGRYTRREFNYRTFKRSFTLPETVDQTAIHAKYENGILYISIPKKAEAVAIKRQIEIA